MSRAWFRWIPTPLADSCPRLAPILKPEAAVRLYSCAYGIPESDFNTEMVSGVPAEKKPRRAKTTDERAELAEKKATPNT